MCVLLIFPDPPLSSLFAMPTVDPRNKVGAIVHAISNRVLGDHAAKNIYGNVNYAKIASWQLPTSKNGSPATLRRSLATSPTSPRPVVNGTKKGRPDNFFVERVK